MKLKNIAKSVIAASALTVASFGANAGAIATSSLDVTGLTFAFELDQGDSVAVDAITFSGSSSSGTINGLGGVDSWDDELTLDLAYSDGTGFDTSGNGTASTVDLSGTLAAGAAGNTAASSSAYGNNSAEADADLENSFNAEFTLASEADVTVTIFFDWVLELYAEITDNKAGQTATAGYGFNISIKEVGSFGSALFNYNMADVEYANEETLDRNTEGVSDLTGVNALTGSYDAGVLTADLLKDTVYTVKISQDSNTDVVSVPEPTSVAILGLGLLGLAGAARRRKA